MKNLRKTFSASLAVLAIGYSVASAQLVTYNFNASNDANTANGVNENNVTPTQTYLNGIFAPATHFVPATTNGNDGLGAGYPFGYTVSANTALFPTSLAGAEAQGTYLTFSIKPTVNRSLTLTNVDFSGASFSSDFAGSNNQTNGNLASG